MKTFYTYIWLREDGTPYYVGKGSGRRGFISNCHKVRRPIEDENILIQEFASEEDAFLAEMFLISFYGRKDLGEGSLQNHTNGGDTGPSRLGKRHSAESIEKMRKAKRGNTSALGHRLSKEARTRIGEINRRRIVSEETRQKNRECALRRWHSERGTECLTVKQSL